MSPWVTEMLLPAQITRLIAAVLLFHACTEAIAQECPSTHDAVVIWGSDWEADYHNDGNDCIQLFKDEIVDSILASLPTYSPREIFGEDPSYGGSYPLEDLQAHLRGNSDLGAAIAVIHGHGVEGGYAFSWCLSDAQARHLAKDVYRLEDDEFIVSSLDIGEQTYYAVTITPTGIAVHLRQNDPDGLLYLAYCAALSSNDAISAWQYHSVMGWSIHPVTNVNCIAMWWALGVLKCPNQDLLGKAVAAVRDNVAFGYPPFWALLPYGPLDKWQPDCNAMCAIPVASFSNFCRRGSRISADGEFSHSYSVTLLGYRPEDAELARPEVLGVTRDIPETGIATVAFEGVPAAEYRTFSLMEMDIWGGTTTSGPFGEADCARASEFGTVRSGESRSVGGPPVQNPLTGVTDAGNGERLEGAGEVVESSDEPLWPPFPSFENTCHVGVYSSDAGLLAAHVEALEGLGWRVRWRLGNGTASDARQFAQAIYDDCNDYDLCVEQGPCAPHPGEYSIRPTLAIVGRYGYANSTFNLATFPDTAGSCLNWYDGAYVCVDGDAPVDLNEGGVPDLPVYYLPAESVGDVETQAAFARMWESGTETSRAILVQDDRVLHEGVWSPTSFAERAMRPFQDAFQRAWHPVKILRRSKYPPSDFLSLQLEFIDELNRGATVVVAMTSGSSQSSRWPASVVNIDWPGTTRRQGLVAIVPSCNILNDPLHMIAAFGAFADTSGSGLAFVTGQMSGAWDGEYMKWAEVLASAYEDAPVGTAWPEIVWEAKRRVVVQYPQLKGMLRSVGSIGSMVRKKDVNTAQVAIEDGESVEGGMTLVRVVYLPGGVPQLVINSGGRQRVSIAIFDVRGRVVARLFEGDVGAGEKRVSWNQGTSSGRSVGRGVYFARVITEHEGIGVTKVIVTK